MIGQLNESQINNILSSQVVGRLACCNAGQPYIVPVTYTYDGKYIYGQTNEGTKLNMLRNNPTVCFEVDVMTNMTNWQSVIIFGTFEELQNKEAENARDTLFNRVYPMLTSSTIHYFDHDGNMQVDDSTRVKTIMYRIVLNKRTGRFEKK